MTRSVVRAEVLGFRVRAQQLDRAAGDRGRPGDAVDDPRVTAPLPTRGPGRSRRSRTALLRVDAGKRIFDAAKPLKAAGIGNLEALDAVGAAMRAVVTTPTVKGEVSRQVADRMPAPYLRSCRPCGVIHLYEMPFRLGALRGGLELQAGTSPPVLQRIPRFRPARAVPPDLDVVRGYLRLFGPATPKQVAQYLDAPVKDVQGRWPEDVVPVEVEGELRSVLPGELDRLGGGPVRTTRLLGPYDLYLQMRDRAMLVADPARAKALWPVIGRPGAVLRDGEIAGLWRPRSASKGLTVTVEPWVRVTAALRRDIGSEAERLAAFRGLRLLTVAGLSAP